MLFLKGGNLSEKFALKLGNALVFAVVEHCPGGRLRVQEQRVESDLALTQEHTDARHCIDKNLVFVPPGLLVVHCGRVVTLSDAAQAVALKMRAEQVYPAHHLPLVHTPKLLKAHVVPAQSEGLRKNLFAPELVRNRAYLVCDDRLNFDAPEPVHAGDMEIFVLRHNRAV